MPFSHGNTRFFRLHAPQVSRGEDDQDWRVDIELLRRELSKVNTTDWKVRPQSFTNPETHLLMGSSWCLQNHLGRHWNESARPPGVRQSATS